MPHLPSYIIPLLGPSVPRRQVTPGSKASGLIRILVMDEDGLDGQPDDADVEPDGPVLDIPDVTLDALLHLPDLLRLTTLARHLG